MAPPEADKPLCFAIMPISMPAEKLDVYGGQRDHFIYVAEHLIKPAAEAAGYEFRAPAATNAEIIQAGIIENLWKADMVLCDISAWNPNVFYEFGIRCALNKPVAMVKDDKTERIPFDTAVINCHPYNSDLSVMTVKKEIPKLTIFLEAAKPQTENTVWKYFGIKESAERPQAENPETAKFDLLMAEVSQLRREVRTSNSLNTSSINFLQQDLLEPTYGRRIQQFRDVGSVKRVLDSIENFEVDHLPGGKREVRFGVSRDGQQAVVMTDGALRPDVQPLLMMMAKARYPQAKQLHILDFSDDPGIDLIDLKSGTEEVGG